MYKKVFACVMVITLLLSLSSSVNAIKENEFSYVDQNVILDTPTEFHTFFESSEIEEIHYNYVLDISENDSRLAHCTISMVIKTNNGCYGASACGRVTRYDGANGISIWHGPLHGVIEVDDDGFNFTLGFTKFVDYNIIHASVSIFDNDSYNPVLFSFGDLVLTDAIIEVFISGGTSSCDMVTAVSADETISPDAIVPTPDSGGGFPDLGANGEWDSLVRDFDYYGGVGSGYYALETRVYFNGGIDQVMVTAMSYCDNIAEKQSSVVNPWVGVKSIDVQLDVLSQAGPEYLYIAGVKSNGFRNSDRLTPGQLIAPLFGDILSLFGVPSSTLTALLAYQAGTVDYEANVDNAYFNIEVDVFDDFRFENEPGLPFVFMLENGDPEDYAGNSRLRCTTTVEYLLWGQSIETMHPAYYYLIQSTVNNFEVTI